MSTTTTISNHSTRETLIDLIETLHNGQEGFRQASEHVKDVHLKELFSVYSLQRSRFAGELKAELGALGEEDPQKEGSTVAGAIHRGWINLKAALTSQDNHAVLAEAERGEDVAVKAFRDALEKELPAPIREIVERQAAEVKAAHDEVKTLRDAAKA